ncbi:MAG: hypothetical protein KAR21_05210 [Spirochaetales bacterium]|nr:hypothetical protein [Spirochaetales bacterium]
MINKMLILMIMSILLISCLEVDSVITLKDDGTGIWNIQYRISQEAALITPGLEFSGFNYFPVNEDKLRKRTSEIAGLELLDVSSKETPEFIEFSVEMSFLDTDNIELFFDKYTVNSVVEISSEENGVFKLTLGKPFNSEIDQDTLRLLSALYSKNIVNIVVELPGIVTESSTGRLSEDPQQAGLELRTTEIITMSEPLEWIVNYE